ncbi:MAG: DUF4157 domain-containing protein [Myxococcales bacterium]|nr:DUF4157 domain-containing protein [Myxococcales bacterium]
MTDRLWGQPERPRSRGAAPGKQTLTSRLAGASAATATQRRAAPNASGAATEDPAAVHAQAAVGVSGSGTELPFRELIERAFGFAHDLSDVRAHVGGAAAAAAEAIGATAYATGNDIAFASAPDLHTAAHEAAHVVQQRAGVHLHGGVGQDGDAHEQHADAVADRVVAGQSAADLLAGGSARGTGTAVQRRRERRAGDALTSAGPDGDLMEAVGRVETAATALQLALHRSGPIDAPTAAFEIALDGLAAAVHRQQTPSRAQATAVRRVLARADEVIRAVGARHHSAHPTLDRIAVALRAHVDRVTKAAAEPGRQVNAARLRVHAEYSVEQLAGAVAALKNAGAGQTPALARGPSPGRCVGGCAARDRFASGARDRQGRGPRHRAAVRGGAARRTARGRDHRRATVVQHRLRPDRARGGAGCLESAGRTPRGRACGSGGRLPAVEARPGQARAGRDGGQRGEPRVAGAPSHRREQVARAALAGSRGRGQPRAARSGRARGADGGGRGAGGVPQRPGRHRPVPAARADPRLARRRRRRPHRAARRRRVHPVASRQVREAAPRRHQPSPRGDRRAAQRSRRVGQRPLLHGPPGWARRRRSRSGGSGRSEDPLGADQEDHHRDREDDRDHAGQHGHRGGGRGAGARRLPAVGVGDQHGGHGGSGRPRGRGRRGRGGQHRGAEARDERSAQRRHAGPDQRGDAPGGERGRPVDLAGVGHRDRRGPVLRTLPRHDGAHHRRRGGGRDGRSRDQQGPGRAGGDPGDGGRLADRGCVHRLRPRPRGETRRRSARWQPSTTPPSTSPTRSWGRSCPTPTRWSPRSTAPPARTSSRRSRRCTSGWSPRSSRSSTPRSRTPTRSAPRRAHAGARAKPPQQARRRRRRRQGPRPRRRGGSGEAERRVAGGRIDGPFGGGRGGRDAARG